MDPRHPDIELLEYTRDMKITKTQDMYNSDNKWSEEDKLKFDEALEKFGQSDYQKIAEYVGNEKTAW